MVGWIVYLSLKRSLVYKGTQFETWTMREDGLGELMRE